MADELQVAAVVKRAVAAPVVAAVVIALVVLAAAGQQTGDEAEAALIFFVGSRIVVDGAALYTAEWSHLAVALALVVAQLALIDTAVQLPAAALVVVQLVGLVGIDIAFGVELALESVVYVFLAVAALKASAVVPDNIVVSGADFEALLAHYDHIAIAVAVIEHIDAVIGVVNVLAVALVETVVELLGTSDVLGWFSLFEGRLEHGF